MQPKLNPVFARFKFNNEIQGSKTKDQYVTSLKLLAKDCLFRDEDNMIRDRILFGVSSQRIREKLINEGEKLTLERAININQIHEYAQEQLQTMSASARPEVHATIQRQAYFDPKKSLTLQVDASKYGLGAALLKDYKPVAYASKSLTTTEINYA